MRQYGAMAPTGPPIEPGDIDRPPRRVIVCDRPEIPDTVERLMRGLLADRERPSIGLATGATFRNVYRVVAERGTLEGVRCFMLDEYAGLDSGHPDSFAATLCAWLPGIAEWLDVLDGAAPDPDAECRRYEAAIGASRVDLQLLGVGVNGHIAFNEPGSAVTSRTRVVELTAATRERNRANLTALAAVPGRALTQGVATILAARAIVVVAIGASKLVPLQRLLDGPPAADVPLSWLRRHPAVTVVTDLAPVI